MKYELIIETELCTSISYHPHNRDGYSSAISRIGKARKKKSFVSAKIVSERDGVVFERDASQGKSLAMASASFLSLVS